VYRPISDYGLIGDTHTAALVSSSGSIDWACLPYFDSPAVFLRILDQSKGGYCSIEAAETKKITRRYLPGTPILETTFKCASGTLQVTDFMPLRRREQLTEEGQDADADRLIIRLLRCTAGSIDVTLEIKPTFDFARESPKPAAHEGKILFRTSNGILQLQGPSLVFKGDTASGKIHLETGEDSFVAIRHADRESDLVTLDLHRIQQALHNTQSYWQRWSRACIYEGEFRGLLMRSAITLKLLTFEPTGAIVAAPTTSLPEELGGERNWDYRFTWVRDSSLTLMAMMSLGYFGEAHDFLHFFKRITPDPEHGFQILYGIRGEKNVEERELKHLDGYRSSKPVRVGNAAAKQKQLDIYGELMQCIHLYANHEAFEHRQAEFLADTWSMIHGMADFAAKHWREPDSGLWEIRGADRQFVDSNALCWVALDRALKLASMRGRNGDLSNWTRNRDAIRQSILEHGYDSELGSFVQSYGSKVVDASSLRLSMVGLIDSKDPRMISTVKQVEQRLMRNGLVYRYRGSDDGVKGDEGSFLMCTFWLMDNYILQGRMKEAEELFQHVISFRNDLGLLSEEVDPAKGEQLGNFPQGFTHISMINTAVRLEAARQGEKPSAHAIVENL
jgi:alpha,alpha-trehalase